MIATRAAAHGLGWRRQARSGVADVIWDGAFVRLDRSIFCEGATLINMIGQTEGSAEDLTAVNVTFVNDLLRVAAETGVAHVVLASSAAVYGRGSGTPLCESADLTPLTAYGTSKARMEDVAHDHAARHATPAITILRIGNVAGADALTQAAQRHLASGTAMPLHLFDNGRAATRSYIGPDDLCEVTRACAPHSGVSPRVLNVAHHQPVQLDHMLAAYRANLFATLDWTETPAPPGIPPTVTLDTEALQRIVTFPSHDEPADAFVRQITP